MGIPSTDQILTVLSKKTAVPTSAEINKNLALPVMDQTMGDKTFADFPAANPSLAPKSIQEGLKRLVLSDPHGNIVPQKVQQQFLPDTKLTTGTPTIAHQIVSVLPQALQQPAEHVIADLHDALLGNPKDRAVLDQYQRDGISVPLPTLLSMQGFLSFIGRSNTDNVEHRAQKLEQAGTDPTRAAAIAFYDVFSQGNPTDKNVKQAKVMLSALTPTPDEQRVLSLAHVGQTLGVAGDLVNVFPGGAAEKEGLARIIQLAQTGERDKVVPTIFSHLMNAGVDKTLAQEYAPLFARSSGFPMIEKGIAALEKMITTTKAMREIATPEASKLPSVAAGTAEAAAAASGKIGEAADMIKPTPLELQHADAIAEARARAQAIPETHLIDTPARNELRASIAEQLYGAGAENKAKRADIVIGLPAAGKSDKFANVLRDAHGSLVIDSDMAKELAPEFEKGIGAASLHKESDMIARDFVLPHAIENGDNVVLPLIGKNTGKIKEIIDDLHAHGYDVHLHHNDVPVEEAVDRSVSRFVRTGRFVDPQYIRDMGLTPRYTYDNLKGYEKLKGISQASNDVEKGQRPILIEEKASGLPLEKFQKYQGSGVQAQAGGRQVLEDARRGVSADETAARNTTLVRSIASEKMTGPVKTLIKAQFPNLTDTTITAFSRRLAQLTRASDIEGILSSMQRLENQGAETAQRALDAVMPTAARLAITPKQAQYTVDQLTREIKAPENAAIAEAEYSHLWEAADQRIVDRFNEANIERAILEEVLDSHPAKSFKKFRLPGQSWQDFNLDEAQITGMRTGSDAKHLDSYATEAGYEDLPAAQQGLEDYLSIRQNLADVKAEIRELRPKVRSAQIVRGILDEVPVVPNARIGAIDEMANTADLRGTYRDISGFAGGFRDMYRNFEHFFGARFPDVQKAVLNPFDDAKSKYVDLYNKLGDEIGKNVVEKYGFKRGSAESAAIQDWGERDLMANPATANPKSIYHTREALIAKFGEERTQDIMAADEWFRQKYGTIINDINDVRKKIYPNNPSKLVPFRKDYYRHYQEFGNSVMDAVRSFMDVPSSIDPKLIGVSEFTKPKSKWASLMQLRKGPQTTRDAIGGFLDYAPSASYAINIDPQIGVFRYLRRKLAEKAPAAGSTENKVTMQGADNFLQFLDDFANNLATKTNPVDRWIQKRIPGGRAAMKAIDWANNRVKANTILGNIGSSVSQLANIPQGVASAKLYALPGIARTLGSIFEKNTAAASSTFLKERYLTNLKDRFPLDFWSKPLKASTEATARAAGELLKVGDIIGTHFIWNSHYAKAVAQGISDPVKYADNITRKLVAGRGIGELSVDQQAKMMQMLAPFTVEVQNLWWVMKDHITARDFAGLAILLTANYLFNEAMEPTVGHRVVYDPINALVEGAATLQNEASAGSTGRGAVELVGRQLGEALTNLPGGQMISSNLPDTMFGIQKKDLFGQGDPNRYGPPILFAGAMTDPLFRVVPPLGGAQMEKTYKGITSLMNHGYTPASGKQAYPIAWTAANFARALAFGPSATTEGHGTYKAADEISQRVASQKAGNSNMSAAAQDEWAKLKQLRQEQGAAAAAAEWTRISQEDPELFSRIKTIAADEAKGLTKQDLLILQLQVGNGARARYVVDQIESLKTKEEKQQLWIDYTKKKILTPEVAKQATTLLNQEAAAGR